MRVGAIPPLRIKDLEPIEEYSIYKITVYAKSKRSSYRTYCSPECKVAIDQYLSLRSRWGDKLHEDEPLFRQDFNTSTPRTKRQQGEIKSIKLSAVRCHHIDGGCLPCTLRINFVLVSFLYLTKN